MILNFSLKNDHHEELGSRSGLDGDSDEYHWPGAV